MTTQLSVAQRDDFYAEAFNRVRQLVREEDISCLKGLASKEAPAAPLAVTVPADALKPHSFQPAIPNAVGGVGAVDRRGG